MKTISSSVNYFHPKVWLRPNLFLCNGFELRQNQEVILEEKAQILYRVRISGFNWAYVYRYNFNRSEGTT